VPWHDLPERFCANVYADSAVIHASLVAKTVTAAVPFVVGSITVATASKTSFAESNASAA